MNVVSREVDLLARDLVRLLSDLAAVHGELAMQMRDKFEAIKHADANRIQSITARETMLAEKAAEREGLRRQITARILKSLGLTETKGEPVTLTRLAEMFPEPRRSQLLVAAAGLRERVHEVDRLRTTLSLITNEMLNHLGEVLKVMCAGVGGDVYSRTGRRQHPGMAAVFEAVG